VCSPPGISLGSGTQLLLKAGVQVANLFGRSACLAGQWLPPLNSPTLPSHSSTTTALTTRAMTSQTPRQLADQLKTTRYVVDVREPVEFSKRIDSRASRNIPPSRLGRNSLPRDHWCWCQSGNRTRRRRAVAGGDT